MAKEEKTADELRMLLEERIARHPLGRTPNAQWIKIVPVDPSGAGANWRVAHSGVLGGLSRAIDIEMPRLQQLYDLRE